LGEFGISQVLSVLLVLLEISLAAPKVLIMLSLDSKAKQWGENSILYQEALYFEQDFRVITGYQSVEWVCRRVEYVKYDLDFAGACSKSQPGFGGIIAKISEHKISLEPCRGFLFSHIVRVAGPWIL